jgi:hypothetical protein
VFLEMEATRAVAAASSPFLLGFVHHNALRGFEQRHYLKHSFDLQSCISTRDACPCPSQRISDSAHPDLTTYWSRSSRPRAPPQSPLLVGEESRYFQNSRAYTSDASPPIIRLLALDFPSCQSYLDRLLIPGPDVMTRLARS